MAKTRTLVVVGSTGGRGSCERCGLVAELHMAVEYLPFAPDWTMAPLDVCLPCAMNAGAVADLPKTGRKEASP